MLYYLDPKDRKALRPLRGTNLAALGWLEKDLENLVAEHIGCAFDFVVDPEQAPKTAVKAWEINEFLKASHRFRQTVYTLPGEALAFIRQRMGEKAAKGKLKLV